MGMQNEEISWSATKDMFRRAFRSSYHYTIASTGPDGMPHVTPVGSVLLTEPQQGLFFDIYTSELSRNLDRDPRFTVMAVDSGKRFWLVSLARGKFGDRPALRLSGTAGPRRLSTDEERQRWLRRVRTVRRLRGHGLLWGDLSYVRDLSFDKVIPVRLGRMGSDQSRRTTAP